MDLQSELTESKVPNMENNETFNQLVSNLATEIDNRVYTNLLDADFTPEDAYQIAFHSSFELDDEPGVTDEQLEAQLEGAILDEEAILSASVA